MEVGHALFGDHLLGAGEITGIDGRVVGDDAALFLPGDFQTVVGDEPGLEGIRQSIELAEKLGNVKTLLNCYKQMSFYGIQVEDPELVKEYLDKGFALLQEEENEERGVFTRLLGWYYLYKKDYEKAEEKFLEAVELFQKPESQEGCLHISIAACYGYLGDLYREQGKLEEAWDRYVCFRADTKRERSTSKRP